MILEISTDYTHLSQIKMKLIFYHNFIMVNGKMIYLMEKEYIYGLKKKKILFLFLIIKASLKK